MKQTAVEWLIDKYIIVGGITKTMVEQAKAMEKEQIIDAVVNTVKIGTEKENVLLFTSEDEIIIRNEADEYYNETFKSE